MEFAVTVDVTDDSCCDRDRSFCLLGVYGGGRPIHYPRGGFMQKLLLIGVAGALGALARYSLGGFVQRFTDANFPWGTFVVNILGAFLFGLIWSLVEQRLVITVETRVIILSGFLGAFTTFSSFMFETSTLIGDGQWGWALFNVVGQIVLGLASMFLGLAAGRAI